jgi:uncharacterized DUF497 family protein
MPDWNEFKPRGFEYDFENDELHAHRISVDEAVQCFDNRQAILRNKSYKDRFKLIGKTDFGRNLCIIFQLKPNRVVRIITGWEA